MESHLISVESQSKHRICPNNKQIRTLNSKNRLTHYNICQEIVQRNQQAHFTKKATAKTLVQTQVIATTIELEQTNINTNPYSLESIEQDSQNNQECLQSAQKREILKLINEGIEKALLSRNDNKD